MTNARYQMLRAKGDKASLIAQLRRAAITYQRKQGVYWESAIRDMLTDLRHLCDMKGLEFGEIDDRAHRGYLEELEFSKTDAA